jgi:Protein of unknown function (DUF5672)
MLKLPSVTLLVVETRARELARLATIDTVAKIQFAEVVICTDDPGRMVVPGARYVQTHDWPTVDALSHYIAFEAMREPKTEHIMFLEWDGGVADPTLWRDQFLAYDYIGAPWPWWHDGMRVGNGGFSIRSRRLANFVVANRHRFPARTDNNLCRDYRRQIEQEGAFSWAPEDVALDFSIENRAAGAPFRHFGFHRARHWPEALSQPDVIERLRIISALLPTRDPSCDEGWRPYRGPHYLSCEIFKAAAEKPGYLEAIRAAGITCYPTPCSTCPM